MAKRGQWSDLSWLDKMDYRGSEGLVFSLDRRRVMDWSSIWKKKSLELKKSTLKSLTFCLDNGVHFTPTPAWSLPKRGAG